MAKDGEVVYEIRGDDSNLDADLNAAQKKVEKAVGSGAEKLKSVAGGAAKAVGAGMAAAGAAASAAGAMAVKSAVQMDQAMNQYIATTGKGTEETERYQNVLEKIYANNYGEDFQDIADAMANVDKQLGDMSDEQLQAVTESAFALRDTFEYEIPESTRAAKAMMNNFGVSGEQAMRLIAAGAQNGLDYSGELIDSISEYSVHFAKLGMDAEDMFKIFQAGADSGAFNLDKVGDAVKELSIRVIDGSDTTKEGFASIGLSADEMAAKFSKGGESAKSAFQETVAALASIEDPLKQNAAGVALFGTMWEDLGPEAVSALADIQEGAYDTADAMGQIKEVKYDDLGSMFEGLMRSVEMLLLPLGEELIPVLTELIEGILPVLEEALPPLMDLAGQLIEQLLPVIEEILPVLLELFNQLLPPLMELIEAVMPILVELFNMLLPPLTEIIGALLPPLIELVGALMPTLQLLLAALNPVIDCFMRMLDPILKLINGALIPLVEALEPVVSIIMDLLVPALEFLMTVFFEVFSGIVTDVSSHIENITTFLNELVDFIKNVFTGNWEGAWKNVSNIFGTIANGLVGIFKKPLNFIIDLINGFLEGLNNIQIPDWVPGIGGKGFDIPKIPRLKTGIDFVPGDYFPAYLDYGERVLTQQENVRFNALGGLEGMEAALSRDSYNKESPKIILGKGCIVVKPTIDGKEMGETLAPYIDTELGMIDEERERGG